MNSILLQMIDHQRVVVGGVIALNNSLKSNTTDCLRGYLASINFKPVHSVVSFREERILKLEEINAPSHMIEHEINALAMITGDAYRVENLAGKSIEELRVYLIDLFIPWREFEQDLDKKQFEDSGFVFRNNNEIPTDCNNVSLMCSISEMPVISSGYFPPKTVKKLPRELLKKMDECNLDNSEENLSGFIGRCEREGYGIFYQVS